MLILRHMEVCQGMANPNSSQNKTYNSVEMEINNLREMFVLYGCHTKRMYV